MTGMSTETVWTPEPGRLVIRINTTPAGRERHRDLLFHCNVADARLTLGVARAVDGTWTPDTGIDLECMKGAECKTGAGNTVTRRYATDEDLAGLVATFEARRSTFAEWVKDVCARTRLADTEKTRLRALVTPTEAA